MEKLLSLFIGEILIERGDERVAERGQRGVVGEDGEEVDLSAILPHAEEK